MSATQSRTGLPEAGLALMRATAGPWLLRKWDVRTRGGDHVPETGPVIIVANHVGWADGPVLVARCPRKLHILTKSEEFEGSNARLLRFTAQIEINRRRTDAGALRRAAGALAAGQAVGVFPEGLRGDGEVRFVKKGAAWLALTSGAPVVPVAIFGTRRPGDGPNARPADGAQIDLVYGRPMTLPTQEPPFTRADIDDASRRVHTHLREHVTWAAAAVKRELPGPMPEGAWRV